MIDVAMGLLTSVPFMVALCFCIGQGLNGRNTYYELEPDDGDFDDAVKYR